MANKIKKPQRGVSKEFFRSSSRNLAKIQAAITELDACVTGYEKRWGIDRLPELVSVNTQVKYWRQVDKLDEAINSDDADMVIKYARQRMVVFLLLRHRLRRQTKRPRIDRGALSMLLMRSQLSFVTMRPGGLLMR